MARHTTCHRRQGRGRRRVESLPRGHLRPHPLPARRSVYALQAVPHCQASLSDRALPRVARGTPRPAFPFWETRIHSELRGLPSPGSGGAVDATGVAPGIPETWRESRRHPTRRGAGSPTILPRSAPRPTGSTVHLWRLRRHSPTDRRLHGRHVRARVRGARSHRGSHLRPGGPRPRAVSGRRPFALAPLLRRRPGGPDRQASPAQAADRPSRNPRSSGVLPLTPRAVPQPTGHPLY